MIEGPRRRRPVQRHSLAWQHLVLATSGLLAVLILLYPTTASWFSALAQRSAIVDYTQETDELAAAEREQLLSAAEIYNSDLSSGLIIDPFSNTARSESAQLDDDARRYLAQLQLPATSVMARLRIEAIDVDLPVYHGATDEVLRNGVGHLYGSSMPVGGAGTHAVLTGHSGLPESELFDGLSELDVGDTFTLETLGRLMTYQVTGTEVVEPTDIEDLAVVEGRDLVTLVTCTPIGVNSHRLLVHAERIANGADSEHVAEPGHVGFPWWAVIAGPALVVWLLMAVRAVRGSIRRRRRLRSTA